MGFSILAINKQPTGYQQFADKDNDLKEIKILVCDRGPQGYIYVGTSRRVPDMVEI